jgi:N-acetylglucosaminyl-diphospho-decaprenol L-rhamnosyltransferase
VIHIEVVIPSAGSVGLLDRALCALRHAMSVVEDDYTLTLVDDSGDDEAMRRVLAERHDARLLRTPGRIGSGPARNLGAAGTRAPWLLFLDDDVELDPSSLLVLGAALASCDASDPVGFIGQLRPPPGAPRWLQVAYRDGTVTPASAGLPPGPVPAISYTSALSLLPTAVFEQAGGFPAFPAWGHEDALLGARLTAASPSSSLVRLGGFTGVHDWVPTWDEWLDRRKQSGARAASLVRDLPPDEARQLLEAMKLDGSPRALPKRAISHVPRGLLQLARGRTLRRLAAAGEEARAFRQHRAGRAE